MGLHYTYYPGCSLHATSKAYDLSTRSTAAALGIELTELENWNCCGATAYMAIKETTAFAVSARNLALAERDGRDLVCPCSGCFVGLTKANSYRAEFPQVRRIIDESLAEAGLSYGGKVRVRHLLDVYVGDVGLAEIKRRVTRPLEGLRVACYYGCQIVRPKNDFDDAEQPTRLERLMEALGALPTSFPMKVWCCGGTLMGTEQRIGLRLSMNLLDCAARGGAEVIVTTCPLCQINLDAYQSKANRLFKRKHHIPVLFFTQAIGIALGMGRRQLGLGSELVGAENVLKKYLEEGKRCHG